MVRAPLGKADKRSHPKGHQVDSETQADVRWNWKLDNVLHLTTVTQNSFIHHLSLLRCVILYAASWQQRDWRIHLDTDFGRSMKYLPA